MPAVSRFSRSIGRPWIIEEFGYPADLPDAERASRFAATYALAARYGAAGTGLWNVGAQTADTYDVGPQFPRFRHGVLSIPGEPHQIKVGRRRDDSLHGLPH